MSVIPCTIRFRFGYDCTAYRIVTAGYKMLEKQGIIKIVAVENDQTLHSSGRYCHNVIVEVEALGKKFAYDLADGYQSLQKKDMFDDCLDGVDKYFKASFMPQYHEGMRNAAKVFPMAFSVSANCFGNPVDKLFFNVHKPIDAMRAIYHYPAKLRNIADSRIDKMVTNNKYDSYNLIFWTRLWDPTPIDPVKYNEFYPYLSSEEAKIWADKTTDMILTINRQRIEIIRNAREHLGSRFVYGLCDNEFSRQLCPELIAANPLVDERQAFLNSIRQNYVCLGSYGLHFCLGAKIGEFMSASRAIMLQPTKYEQPSPLVDGINFVEYESPDALPEKAEKLLSDVDRIHAMEDANAEYFKKYCTPDKMILNTLRIVFPDQGLGEYLS